MTLIEDFATLFDGNPAATGTEQGGCDRTPVAHHERIRQHLHEGPPIGIYPMRWGTPLFARDLEPTWNVRWGMVDYDEGDEVSLRHALQLRDALRVTGITGWVERSKSKGFHVWVFAIDYVPAADMRNALLWVSDAVGTPTKEVNPKQYELNEDQLGNYARLPYPGFGAMATAMPPKLERRVVLHPATGLPMSLADFTKQAMATRVSEARLAELAARYKPPVKHVRTFEPFKGDVDADIEELLESAPRLARKIWREGPLDGGDRSSAMFKLASLIYEDDSLSYEETFALLAAAEWNKFHGRSDHDLRITNVLDRIWR